MALNGIPPREPTEPATPPAAKPTPSQKKGHIGTHVITWLKSSWLGKKLGELGKKISSAWQSFKAQFSSKPKTAPSHKPKAVPLNEALKADGNIKTVVRKNSNIVVRVSRQLSSIPEEPAISPETPAEKNAVPSTQPPTVKHRDQPAAQPVASPLPGAAPMAAYKPVESPAAAVTSAPAQPVASPLPSVAPINPMRERADIGRHKPTSEQMKAASLDAGAGAKAAKARPGNVRPTIGSIVAMVDKLGNEIGRGQIVGVIEKDDLFYIKFPPSEDNIPFKLINKYENILVSLDGKESVVKVIKVKKSEKEKGGLRFKNNI